jgi:hypothetical protein
MKMLLTMGEREFPIAMSSLLEEFVVNLKIRGSQADLHQFHDGFDLQDRSFQCVIVVELIFDDL